MSVVHRIVRRTVEALTSCVRGQIDEDNPQKGFKKKKKNEKKKKRSFRLWLFRRRGKKNDTGSPPGSTGTLGKSEDTTDTKPNDGKKDKPADVTPCGPTTEGQTAADKESDLQPREDASPEAVEEEEVPTVRKVSFHGRVKVKVIKLGTSIPPQRGCNTHSQSEVSSKLPPVENTGLHQESHQGAASSSEEDEEEEDEDDKSSNDGMYPEIMEITRRTLDDHPEEPDSPSPEAANVDLSYPDVEDSLELWFRNRGPTVNSKAEGPSNRFSHYGHLSDASSEDLHYEKTDSDGSVYGSDSADPGVPDIPLDSSSAQSNKNAQPPAKKMSAAERWAKDQSYLDGLDARRIATRECHRELFLQGVDVRRQFRPGRLNQAPPRKIHTGSIYDWKTSEVRRLSMAVGRPRDEESDSDSDF